MGEEIQVGCARPDGNTGEAAHVSAATHPTPAKEVPAMIKVGGSAPDFQAQAYQKGKFISVKLSEHLGKWVVLCFYPGDFTFV